MRYKDDVRKKIGVFCGSSKSTPGYFLTEAREVGRLIGDHGFDLVWGGCNMASMNEVALGVQEGGGKVTGVIPESFIGLGLAYAKPDKQITVPNLAKRKERIRELADVFLVLPGGLGTLDELFDTLAFQKVRGLGQAKLTVIYSYRDFFQPVIDFLRSLAASEFIGPTDQGFWATARTRERVLELLIDELG